MNFLLISLTVHFNVNGNVLIGICDDSQVTPSSYQKSSVKGDDESLTHRHAQNWKGWEDWVPSKKTEIQAEQQQHQQYVPLSPAEHAKLHYRRNRTDNKKSGGTPETQRGQSQSRSSKNSTEKTGNKDFRRDEGEKEFSHKMHHYKSANPLWELFPEIPQFEYMFPNIKMDFDIFELEMFLRPALQAKKSSSKQK